MANKVDIELVQMILQRADLDALKVSQIMEDLKFESKQKDSDEDKEPPVKKQSVIVVSDPYGRIAATGFEYFGWVLDIPEDEPPQSALERMHKAVYDFNVTPKGRRMAINNISDAFEFMPKALQKEHKCWAKTKEPVLVLVTNGKIPREERSE